MKTNELIKARRQELGLTIREVADRVGVGPSTVSRWESGNIANMRRDKISKLAKVLDLDPDVLTGYGHASDAETQNGYYNDKDVARMANELKERPDLRVLLDASRDLSKDDMFELIDIINKIKDGTWKE
jgi:transcriptional regulator with XRE-family HTH domain